MTTGTNPLNSLPEYTKLEPTDPLLESESGGEARELPNTHPFEDDPESRKQYLKLTRQLDRKIRRMWKFQFNGKLPMSYDEVQKSLQPPLDLSADEHIELTESDTKILEQLGNNPADPESETKIQEDMIALLEELVAINSQTGEVAGNRQVRQTVARELEQLGFEITEYPEKGVTVASHHPEKYVGDRVIMLGHTDTVLTPETYVATLQQQDGYIYGSGVADMKGGLVIMVTALQAMHEAGELQDRYITVLLNSDEEVGSRDSRAVIEELGKDHDVGMVFESGKVSLESAGGGLTLGRKGIYALSIDISGQSAHSGVAHYQGVDAGAVGTTIATNLSAMTDYQEGVTVNVGVIQPNDQIARNRVIETVHLKVEFRTWDTKIRQELAEEADLLIHGAMLCSPYAKDGEKLCTDVHIDVGERPPAPVTKDNEAWFEEIAGIAEEIDFPIQAVTSGGGSDQNLLVSAGMTRVIDSWGPIGYGLHSSEERLYFESFLPRAQLVALTINHTAGD